MATRKLNTKGRREDKYKGNYPSVFKKIEQSDNKIKEAVDNEVKEKFTKSTDPKDIFNELFGESKK